MNKKELSNRIRELQEKLETERNSNQFGSVNPETYLELRDLLYDNLDTIVSALGRQNLLRNVFKK